MGKNKKLKEGNQSEHCPATVFVSKLPFSLTNSQLEEAFSDVGPIRRSFMVTKKGTTEHRGIGFVQFATAEDADRAIEMKDGSDLGGRKIAVKYATHRAPLEQRRSKLNKADSNEVDETSDEKDSVPDAAVKHEKSSNEINKTSDEKASVPNAAVKHKKSSNEVNKTPDEKASVPNAAVKHEKSSSVHDKGQSVKPVKKAKKPSTAPADKGKSSEKQRVARTVIFGGLVSADMAEEVLRLAREIDGVLTVTYPLPKGQLQNHSLHQDGCRPEAAAVVYASIRSALAAVAALHQKQVNGRSVWARQLGGEGSKTQKWKIIIRNLPFRAKASKIKEQFSAAGLVWDVFVPKNSETGMAKGFAFIKFTSKHDAENAILKFNGKKFGSRTIAVDWAVPKKLYTTGLTSAAASEDGEHGDGDADSDGDDGSEDYDLIHEKKDKVSEGSDIISDDSDVEEEKDVQDAVDFDEEVEIAQKVLENVITSSKEAPPLSNGSDLTESDAKIMTESKQTEAKPKPVDEDLSKTVFISNLPFDLDNEEVKQRFSSFGEVQSFFPVLHPVTKRPRGTGFLKFTTADGANSAVTAANAAPGLGVFLKGRQLTVFKALDKKSANDKALEKSKNENQDQRNLYLAKEGLIVEGTPAAEGVSKEDLEKRQALQQKKTSKLQSPNFHVSTTRLVIYNLPKSMTEKQLKKLCIDAVTSKASKQKPVIRQLKFLNDVKKGKVKGHSRGVAFVEFGEHQHAIVALRVLNNNPEPFGPNHRPIVEFAVDNVQTLRKRNLKIYDQLQKTGDNPNERQQNDKTSNKERPQKRKFESDKRSKEDHQELRSKTTRGDNQMNRNRNKAGFEREEGSNLSMGDFKRGNNQNPAGNFVMPTNENPRKRKVEEVDEGENPKRRNRNKNKEVVGKDVGDQLDTLIQQYRSKFSQKNSDASEGEKQGSRQQIRRWFQS